MKPEDLVLSTRTDMEMLAHLRSSYRMATELMEMAAAKFSGMRDGCEHRTNLEPPFKRSEKGTFDTCKHAANSAGECHIICCPLEERD